MTTERLREIEERCEAVRYQNSTRAVASRRNIVTEICNFVMIERAESDAPPIAYAGSIQAAEFMAAAFNDIPDLLAALKQVAEERDRFAAVADEARRRLEHIQNCQRPPTVTQEQFIFNLQANATQALVNIADPAACLKARDAEIAAQTKEALGEAAHPDR